MKVPAAEKSLTPVISKPWVAFSEHASLPRSRGLRNSIFVLLLLGALASGPWLWLARIAWGVLPLFFFVDFSYALYSVFFFAAFFHPTGFLPSFFFSIKHFHIVLILTAAVQIIRGHFWDTLMSGTPRMRAFYPLLGIVLIALAVSIFRQRPASEIMTAFNLMSIVGSFFYLSSLLKHKERLAERSILFFAAGVCVQVLLVFYNMGTNSNIFGLQFIAHNNHLGILCALTFFYPLAFAASETRRQSRIAAWFLVWVLFLGMFFSCSRTAWFSFLFSSILFGIFFKALPSGKFKSKFARDSLGVGLVLLFAIFVGITKVYRIYYFLYWRFQEIPRLWNAWFWNYTLHDHQNFGFLGIHRLNQLYQIKAILKYSPIFGVGFVSEVVDFHSLYLTILGASGVLGLGLFIFFCVKMMTRLLWAIRTSVEIPSALMRIGAFCAVTAWLLMGFMEGLVLQYPIWMHALFAVLLGHLSTPLLTGVKRSSPR